MKYFFFFFKTQKFWYNWNDNLIDQLLKKNLGIIVTLLGDTGCQSLLNEGVKILKLKLLGSIQRNNSPFLEFLLWKKVFSQLFEKGFSLNIFQQTETIS